MTTFADGEVGSSIRTKINAAIMAVDRIDGYLAVTASASSTILTSSSAGKIRVTGATTQTIVLPVASTIAVGVWYGITNDATGDVTVQSSGLNDVVVIPPGFTALVQCILASGTTAASWDVIIVGVTTPGRAAITSGSIQGVTSVQMVSTDDGATLGPNFVLHRDSASPAAGDNLGSIRFSGEDAASNETIYAMVYGFITDTTNGAERGGLAIQTMQSGTLTDALVVDSQGKVGLGSSVPSAYQAAYSDLVVGRASEASGGIVIVGSSVSTIQFVDNISGAETRDALIQMDHVLDRLSLNADAATPLLNLFGAASSYAGNVGIGTSTPATKLDVNGGVKIGTTTVAGLPAAATAGAGARFFVSDGTAAAFRTVVVGGGSVFLPVYSDGTDWRIG